MSLLVNFICHFCCNMSLFIRNMSKGKFDDLLVLVHHLPIVQIKTKQLVSALEANDLESKLKGVEVGRISAQVQTKSEEVLNDPSKIKLTKEQTLLVDDMIKPNKKLLSDIDYIVQWLKNSIFQLNSLEMSSVQLNLTWGNEITINFCKIFSTVAKIYLQLASIGKNLFKFWQCSLVSSYYNEFKNLHHRFINKKLEPIASKPLETLEESLRGVFSLCHQFIQQTSIILSLLFYPNPTFDWSQFSIDSDDFIGESTGPLLPQHYILRNLTLYTETIKFMAIVFPTGMSKKVEFHEFISTVFSESDRIYINENKPVKLSEIIKMRTFPIEISKLLNVPDMFIRKKFDNHPTRIIHLTNLLRDVEEHYDICNSLLWIYNEEILALFGFSFYEINICFGFDDEQCSQDFKKFDVKTTWEKTLELLSVITRILNKFESNAELIKRNHIFNLATQDYEFLEQQLQVHQMFEMDEANATFDFTLQVVAKNLYEIDLEEYDKGTKYDFMPLILTCGRLLLFSFSNKITNQIMQILQHISTIIRHADNAVNPVQVAYDCCPICQIVNFEKIMTTITQPRTTNIDYFRYYMEAFRYIPNTQQSDASFENCYKNYLDRLVGIFANNISISNSTTLIIRQGEYDPTFKPSNFYSNFFSDRHQGYKTSANLINKQTSALNCVYSLPQTTIHGKMKVKVKNMLRDMIMDKISKTLCDSEPNPLIVISLINVMIQTLQGVARALGFDLISFIISELRKQLGDFQGMTLSKKADILMSSRSPSLSGYVSFFTSALNEFISGGHKRSIYEPFGLRFVGDTHSKHPFDLLLAQSPIGDLLHTFGYDIGIASMHEINKLIADNFRTVATCFNNNKSIIASWYTAYDHTKERKFPTEFMDSAEFSEASEKLMNIGVATVLYNMIKRSANSMTSALFPGFNDAIMAAIHKKKTLKPNEMLLAEIVGVSERNYFLAEQLKMEVKMKFDDRHFLFFLALLFGNTQWDYIHFSDDNDSFTHNMQCLTIAIGTILDNADILLEYPDQDSIRSAERTFFAALAEIAKIKREREPESYHPFLILMDHFPYFTQKVRYGAFEQAFPYILIRNAYNMMSKEPDIIRAVVRDDMESILNAINKAKNAALANPNAANATNIVETRSVYGSTPLIMACRDGNFRIAKCLVENGADVNAKTDNGNFPLFIALADGREDIAKLLIENGADVNMKGPKGFTPLKLVKSTELQKLIKSKGGK